MKELQINEQIRDREVRLIGDDGQQYGVISMRDARAIAEEKGLDICKVSPPSVQPPTCKLMDYGKYRYEQQKREKEAKKNQKSVFLRQSTSATRQDLRNKPQNSLPKATKSKRR